MWWIRATFDLLGPAGAARNAGAVLEDHRNDLAEVDSVVARLRSHAAARPAA